jgi:hypothetical protein
MTPSVAIRKKTKEEMERERTIEFSNIQSLFSGNNFLTTPGVEYSKGGQNEMGMPYSAFGPNEFNQTINTTLVGTTIDSVSNKSFSKP